MSKYIEAEWLKARIPSEEMIAKMAVAQAPTIDIVHCRECKCGEHIEEYDAYLCLDDGFVAHDANYFCAGGIPREREGE